MNEREIFVAAVEKGTAQERSDFLSTACGGDSALRMRIDDLLQMHEKTGEFLQKSLVERLAEGIAALEEAAETGRDPTTRPNAIHDLGFLTPPNEPGSLGRLGHYEVQEVIGRGGMGIVLRAFDEKLHRVVAIKVMAAPLATNAAARKRFLREARAAAAVCHDNIVTIHAVEESGDLPYLVMQCVSGLSLQQRIDRDGPLALHEILRIGRQTAAGLDAAHAQGLIHRDIKPANILLENGVERVKITDFGLARAAADASVSQTGIVAGTPQYMAPEQARGEALDCRVDLFSLGSVLYAMCTGRAPFRASNSMAVLKRVCDDAPSPIREANADVPDWLVELIDKLQAKNPSDRYQSAAEVAEVLGRRLAQLQHSTPLPPLASPKPAPARPAERRWPTWSVTAAVVLGLAATLSIAEGTGATKIGATVIRIFTPGGTLVVETDDPAVKVTIEGDGGLIITGAGLHEVHLKPGSYKLQADKNGQPVPLERELVSIAQGGREVVRVKLETPPAPPVAKAEKGSFVLLAGQGALERKYDTLGEAVLGASDGDTIEIRGNGPFVSQPITIQRNTLTIRAGEGFRPVLKLSPDGVKRGLPLITTNYALMLEGLELHRAPGDGGDHNRVLQVNGAVLRAANCRFRSSIWTQRIPGCVFLNCEFLSDEAGFLGQFSPGARFIHENCLHRTGGASLYLMSSGSASDEVSIQIRRSTFWSRRVSVWWAVKSPLAVASDRPQGSQPIRLDVSQSIFDTPSVLGFEQHKDFVDKAGAQAPAEAEALLLRLIQWRGERNLLPAGSTSVVWGIEGKKQPAHGPKNLEEWQKFWGAAETSSLEGRLRFQGGDLLTRTEASVDELTPDDFRLSEASAGYRAGPEDKDLGADVDLVGPGLAYDRWKKTPEYQEWLEDSRPLKVLAAAVKPETSAFVVQGGKDIPERKYDTLAEAVHGASDGDTIEVRGNGPFITEPVRIYERLIVKAGGGYRPVLRLSKSACETREPLLRTGSSLVLEGLEFQRTGTPTKDGENMAVSLVRGDRERQSFHVANCRFHLETGLLSACIDVARPHSFIVTRNCEFYSPQGWAVAAGTKGPRRLMDNCVYLGGECAQAARYYSAEKGEEIELTRNTVVSSQGLVGFLLHTPLPQGEPQIFPTQVRASGNIVDAPAGLHILENERFQTALNQALGPKEFEALARRIIAWLDRENLYRVGGSRVTWKSFFKSRVFPPPLQSPEEWKRFWDTPDATFQEGQIQFYGGSLQARLAVAPNLISPADFRLRPDSAGYRAGPDGKDLGADVDLVGPGTAYERWKKTPEYQDWLKDTGQMK